MNALVEHISSLIGHRIESCTPVSGGDISSAYKISSLADSFFLKLNTNAFALDMFEAEHAGLQAMAETGAIGIPEVLLSGEFENQAFILMEFIPTGNQAKTTMQSLGRQLALMHKTTQEQFGFWRDNYIGSLPQFNESRSSWIDFYAEMRLKPQLQMALRSGLLKKTEVPEMEYLESCLSDFIAPIQPALIHGDLWGGNFLIADTGKPFLIDPAVYFGHAEIDLAMSRLFGGFGSDFYSAYYEVNPKEHGEAERMELYQLYYLLVHLNLFGSSYSSSVKRILHKYFPM